MARRIRTTLFVALAASSLQVAPAQASTLPRVDFKQGDKIVAAGLLDLNFDYAFSERVSFGASLIPSLGGYHWSEPALSPISFALRSSAKLGEIGSGASYGVTLSSGVSMSPVVTMCGPGCNPFDLGMGIPHLLVYQYIAWVQPALNLSIPFSKQLTLRATLGPVVTLNGSFGFEPRIIPVPIPSVELAYALDEKNELTLLGNALLGWRGIF